jgi:hypothetical protein
MTLGQTGRWLVPPLPSFGGSRKFGAYLPFHGVDRLK